MVTQWSEARSVTAAVSSCCPFMLSLLYVAANQCCCTVRGLFDSNYFENFVMLVMSTYFCFSIYFKFITQIVYYSTCMRVHEVC